MKKTVKKNDNKQVFLVYRYFIGKAFKHAPHYFTASFINLIAESIFPFIEVIFLPLIIDELMQGKRLNHIILYLLGMLVGNLIVNYIIVRSELESDKYSNDIDNYFMELMSERTMDMDFALTEDKNALDQLEKAKEGISYAGAGWTISSMKYIIISIIQLLGALVLVLLVAPWVLLISVFKIIVTTLVNSKNNRDEVSFYKKRASVNRAYQYTCFEIADIRYGKDIRLYGAAHMMLGNTAKYIKIIGDYWKEQASRRTKVVFIDCMFGALTASIIYLYLGYLTMTQLITIGVFTQMLSLTTTVGNAMTGITYGTQDVLKLSNYAVEYVKFMEYPTMIHRGTKIPGNGPYHIEVKNVSFSYPNSEQKVLQNVNLDIFSGVHLSVVGLNGAGKTTFIKLLCRLYEVSEGEILLDGININEYDYDSYIRLFSPVFQDFKLFSFSANENIVAGDKVENLQKVQEVCESADIMNKLNSLPNQLKTPIFKNYEENGIELSGGEQQKMAIARAIYRNASILILDEPTAALDPLAEYEVYKKFNEISGDKTAVFISHRLSSCRFCDRIVVFSNGTIQENGTHDELVNLQGGIYAKMWSTQAKYYK